MYVELSVNFERELAISGSKEATLVRASALSRTQRQLMLRAISSASNASQSSPTPMETFIEQAFPKFIRLPSVADAQPLALIGEAYWWHTRQSLILSLRTGICAKQHSHRMSCRAHRFSYSIVSTLRAGTRVGERTPGSGSVRRWWGLQQAERDASPFNTTTNDGLQIVVAGERLAGGSAAIAFTAGGVLAFYALVVFAIGRVVRGVLRDSRYKLIVDEMPDTRDLIDLCEGVYIARHEGQLMLETELHETILRLYRSPVSLLQLTGDKLER